MEAQNTTQTPSLQALHALILDGDLGQAVRMCDQLAAVQQGVQPIANELADMLERSITGLGHYRNTENWSQADEEHISECNALLDRFACADDEATHPAPLGLSDAARDVIAERHRQISAEGWTPEHDDLHGDGTLAFAAVAYAVHHHAGPRISQVLLNWTDWCKDWWKPKSKRQDLTRSGALILAKLERIDRAAQAKQGCA